MRARGFLLALCAASAAMRAEGQREPDWFDAFRGKAYLQGDSSWVAREGAAAPDSPPLFRVRWVVLRFSAFTDRERRFWPYRNLLLVTTPGGARYVLESSHGYADENHLDEDGPFQRVASERSAFEIWVEGLLNEPTAGAAPEAAPCDGGRYRVRAPGGALELFLEDFGSRTVRTTVAEIVSGTFDENERRDLAALGRLSLKSNSSLGSELPVYHLRDALIGVNLAFRDQLQPPEKRTVVLAPDPAPPGDLALWRGLAHLPLDLPPFLALPPESPVR